jgi:hypothetical protein
MDNRNEIIYKNCIGKNNKKNKNFPVNKKTTPIMISLSSLSLVSAVAATATIDIVAKVVRPIDIVVNSSMDFGTLAVTNAAEGKATINPLTDNLFVDGRSSLALTNGHPRAGRLKITGAPGAAISISMEKTEISLTNGSTSLMVDNFSFATSNGLQGTKVTLTPTGTNDSLTLAVGATLNTREAQLSGSYVGSNRIFANLQ